MCAGDGDDVIAFGCELADERVPDAAGSAGDEGAGLRVSAGLGVHGGFSEVVKGWFFNDMVGGCELLRGM